MVLAAPYLGEMRRTNIIATWVGVVATLVLVFGGITYANKSDPVGHVIANESDRGIVVGHESAYGAVHGIVIYPYRG